MSRAHHYDRLTGFDLIYSDLEKLYEGISEKLGIFMYQVFSGLVLIVAAFVWGWQLTLACLAAVPISVLVAGGVSVVCMITCYLLIKRCDNNNFYHIILNKDLRDFLYVESINEKYYKFGNS